jgi:hypothetical protein
MRYRAKCHSASRRVRFALFATLVTAALPLGAGAARASNVQDGSNRSHTSQRGSSQTGDAIGGGQVVGAVGGGNVDLTATNQADNSTAVSGDASGSNTLSGVFVGNESSSTAPAQSGDTSAGVLGSGTDGQQHPVDALGPVAPVVAERASGTPAATPAATVPASVPGRADVLGPPGPLGPTAADTGSGSNVQVGDNVLNYSQSADVHTGAAVAGGQIVGSAQTGNVTITLSNRATNSEATSGNGQMDNTLTNVRVGSLATDGPVAADGPIVPEELQVAVDAAASAPGGPSLSPDILAAVRAIDAEVASRAGSLDAAFSSRG